MQQNLGLAHVDRPRRGAVARALAAADVERLGIVAAVTVLVSLRALISPALLDFFSPAELVLAWLGHLAELAVIAAALLSAYSLLDRVLPPRLPLRLGAICGLLVALSAALAVLLHAYYAGGLQHLPPALRIFADALRWGVPAVILASIAALHRRALQIDSAAHAAEIARAKLQQGESEQELALLQAQIEPHFLFNMLATVRRLYRTRPEAGANAVESLMQYLRATLPQLRSRNATLGEEVALVEAYLRMFQLRMAAKLEFSIDVPPPLRAAAFPPMLVLTLVENAIRHGLEPAGGGRVGIRAMRRRGSLVVTVDDDGVGFGAMASCGTGVGLANIRRQLAARFPGDRARLVLQGGHPRGASATIVVPLCLVRHAGSNNADGLAV